MLAPAQEKKIKGLRGPMLNIKSQSLSKPNHQASTFDLEGPTTKADSFKKLQSESTTELEDLTLSILDKAFNGEL